VLNIYTKALTHNSRGLDLNLLSLGCTSMTLGYPPILHYEFIII